MLIWCTESGKLVHAVRADDEICNCVQSHPFDPVIATSGIQSVVKLWTAKKNTAMPQDALEKIVQSKEHTQLIYFDMLRVTSPLGSIMPTSFQKFLPVSFSQIINVGWKTFQGKWLYVQTFSTFISSTVAVFRQKLETISLYSVATPSSSQFQVDLSGQALSEQFVNHMYLYSRSIPIQIVFIVHGSDQGCLYI